MRQKASEVATKVLASKLLDGALFESAFADALSSAKNTDLRSVVAPVAKACADFAKAWLLEASSAGFSKLPPEVALDALERAVAAALDAAAASDATEPWLREVAVAADCFDGALTRAAPPSARAAIYAGSSTCSTRPSTCTS